jgi:hypothetical protein
MLQASFFAVPAVHPHRQRPGLAELCNPPVDPPARWIVPLSGPRLHVRESTGGALSLSGDRMRAGRRSWMASGRRECPDRLYDDRQKCLHDDRQECLSYCMMTDRNVCFTGHPMTGENTCSTRSQTQAIALDCHCRVCPNFRECPPGLKPSSRAYSRRIWL